MNVFSGHISNIQVNKSLSMVAVHIREGVELKTMVVETPATASYLRTGSTVQVLFKDCLLYTSPSPRDLSTSRMPSSA